MNQNGLALSTAQMASGLVAIAALSVVLLTDDPSLRVLAIAVAGITSFATRSLPEITTALFIFLAFLATGVAPTQVIFSGFATSGFWLLVGGLIIGAAIASSGLGDQLARRIYARTGASYPRAILFLSFGGLVLGALVPSAIPRVIVMMPITLSLASTMGLAAGSRGHTGLLMAAATMTLSPTYAFLTANLPTIVELGAIEILYGEHIRYGAYFTQNLPINLVRFAVLLWLLLSFVRTDQPVDPAQKTAPAARDLTPAQRRLMWVLIVAVGFWATDALHGIAPAWVTICAAVVLLLPQARVFPPQAMKTDIDLSIAFLIAAVFAISAVMTEVGLGRQIADLVVPNLRLGTAGAFWDLAAITGFSAVLSHLTIAPATPIVLAPLAGAMSDATQWSINTVAMAHNVGISITALPYQSPPLLIGIAMAQIPIGALTRLCFVSAIVSAAIGIPLTWVWWSWLGLI